MVVTGTIYGRPNSDHSLDERSFKLQLTSSLSKQGYIISSDTDSANRAMLLKVTYVPVAGDTGYRAELIFAERVLNSNGVPEPKILWDAEFLGTFDKKFTADRRITLTLDNYIKSIFGKRFR